MYYPSSASALICGGSFNPDPALPLTTSNMVKAPPGHFSILYFAAASTFTAKPSEHLPAAIKARHLFAVLESKYPGISEKVLSSCAVSVNVKYIDIEGDDAADLDLLIEEGDEVAIIPPVSSG
ncbi:hypothetical protein CC78DRAFT_579258 [Lojkania enalia]|uniref:Molybdopterin synthase sulfur carrier subunit n=1 Tax=Lojkania enalia TaxID=147567 RepID=A0A9P4N513_9PLEO|nr:hypothetical protein CC78DRAFT_579258 [Didymosphaeria enalia]